jgi:hypothetical protein
VRLLVSVSIVLGMLTAPAVACPPVEACMVAMKSTTELPREQQATVQVNRVVELRLASDATRPAPGAVEMPWIWRALRDQVYSRMPTYEKPDDDLKLTLAPVVVTSPSDTVPGLGIAGDF